MKLAEDSLAALCASSRNTGDFPSTATSRSHLAQIFRDKLFPADLISALALHVWRGLAERLGRC
jgi:hypothetical protein